MHTPGRSRSHVAASALLAAGLLLSFPADAQAETAAASPWELILGQPVIALFVIIGSGLLIGRIRIYGVSLGSSGVIFTAIAFGAMGYTIPDSIGAIGLVLFVYCVGITAGPTFFRAFVEQGADLAKLGVLLVTVGAGATVLFGWLTGAPLDLSVGIFAGAMTSTPALAAALDNIQSPGVSIGYGIAYPFGVVGVVLFVQLLPRLLGKNLDEEARALGPPAGRAQDIRRVLVEVRNPALFGKKVCEATLLPNSRCQISRVLWDDTLVPLTPETQFEEGQCVLVVGESDRLPDIVDYLGRESDRHYHLDLERTRMKVVATSPDITGKTLRQLNVLNRFGVTVSRIIRNEVTLIPNADSTVQRTDVLHCVGEPEDLRKFAEFAGHRARVLDETDLISLNVGIIAGMILGMAPIALPGTGGFTLGMSGGPLLVGLVLGHFGHVGKIRGHIPRAARMLLTESGLVFFLASAGIKAGGQFFDVLSQYGVMLVVMGAAVTLAPMAVGYVFARRVLKLNLLQTLGGTCGSMTSTPGLGALSDKTDSEIPAISYATAYPVALILMTVFAKVIIKVLGALG